MSWDTIWGLQHGGGNGVNNKPNYLSVMNYLFQIKGLRYLEDDGRFDYSRFDLDDLTESNLNESEGLNGPVASIFYGTRWCCIGGGNSVQNFATVSSIDWNCNSSTESPVSVSINCDASLGTLTSFNDWPNLVYDGGIIGDVSVNNISAPAQLDTVEEMTWEIYQSFCHTKPGDWNGDSKVNLSDLINQVNYVFKGGQKPSPFCRGDDNADYKVNLKDIVYKVNHIFKGGPKPIPRGDCCLL